MPFCPLASYNVDEKTHGNLPFPRYALPNMVLGSELYLINRVEQGKRNYHVYRINYGLSTGDSTGVALGGSLRNSVRISTA